MVEEENKRKIFIGNILFDDISHKVTQLGGKVDLVRFQHLYQLRLRYYTFIFSQYGKVEGLTFHWEGEKEERKKGHFFVTYTTEEAANSAITTLKKFDLRQDAIRIITAKVEKSLMANEEWEKVEEKKKRAGRRGGGGRRKDQRKRERKGKGKRR
eukprot:TRINITY_DN3417_c0_g1_i4.p3 TRINITY_DN3417_c0_g1~~TRINITY_DN3417_c0_g1_i4.p3  ORF type:complete len:155 (-),score=64.79 TRINITY_DN3417_c0_g1_i4:905-1369(-)